MSSKPEQSKNFETLATHQQLTPEERLSTGVSDGLVRLSVGLEHLDDILAALEQALSRA